MNYKMILSILGRVLLIEAVLMICPMLVGVVYKENNFTAFLYPVLGLMAIGFVLSLIKIKDRAMYVKEGFVIVAIAWLCMSAVGALPFVINGEIPNYIDAFFETVSGFTTTGATILSGDQIEGMSKALTFWRMFTHWIGGMGVLVFVLAIVPGYNAGIMHVFRAESPGPSVGKLVSKLTHTARILYGIYIVMTVVQAIFLLCGGNSLYNSVLLSFSTAGTGGFSMYASSAADFSLYTQMVLAVFMFLFGINFNIYYLILIGSVSKVLKNEELRMYLIVVFIATLSIAINIISIVGNFGLAISQAFFQVTSITSTTGLATADFDTWPDFSRAVLLLLTIVGACGGSTGGGMKFARLGILIKSCASDIKRMIHPRAVVSTKFEGETLDEQTIRNSKSYLLLWLLIVILSTLLLSLDYQGTAQYDGLFTNFSATLACIGNVGPGFAGVGPMCSYAMYSPVSKIVLSFVMLIGRLEIFPILILFSPRTWRRV